jgi:hypothetical protein
MPSWASWSSSAGFLPKEFHTEDGPNQVLKYLATLPIVPPLNRNGMEQLLLLLGLTSRDVWRSVELHWGEAENGCPQYVEQCPVATEREAKAYLKKLYGVPVLQAYKVPPKAVKRKADGTPSGARYVIP